MKEHEPKIPSPREATKTRKGKLKATLAAAMVFFSVDAAMPYSTKAEVPLHPTTLAFEEAVLRDQVKNPKAKELNPTDLAKVLGGQQVDVPIEVRTLDEPDRIIYELRLMRDQDNIHHLVIDRYRKLMKLNLHEANLNMRLNIMGFRDINELRRVVAKHYIKMLGRAITINKKAWFSELMQFGLDMNLLNSLVKDNTDYKNIDELERHLDD